jgi:hypothetical protein
MRHQSSPGNRFYRLLGFRGLWSGGRVMKYQDVEYGVHRLAPGKFLWTIYVDGGKGPKIESKVFHATQGEAEAACRKVIDQSKSTNATRNFYLRANDRPSATL